MGSGIKANLVMAMFDVPVQERSQYTGAYTTSLPYSRGLGKPRSTGRVGQGSLPTGRVVDL